MVCNSMIGSSAAGKPWEFCPRSALRRTLAALQSEFGITMKVIYLSVVYMAEGCCHSGPALWHFDLHSPRSRSDLTVTI
jgi:hypothetical protein